MHFLAKWDKTDNLNILGIGLAATIRARSSSILIVLQKQLLRTIFGLMHRFFYNDKIFIQFYNLGYVDIFSIHARQKIIFTRAKPDYVAKEIVLNLNKKSRVAFIPFWWIVVSVILNIVPWFLYKRIKI